MVNRSGWVLTGAALCFCAACGAGDEAATTAATQFLNADGAEACGLLSPSTAESLTSDGTDCAAALEDLDLPRGTVESASVWSDRAQVHTTDDVLFLVDLPAGWRVTAAGCTPRPDQTYRCLLEGN